MSSWLRLWLMIVLAVALPIQGAAAATMHCDSLQQGSTHLQHAAAASIADPQESRAGAHHHAGASAAASTTDDGIAGPLGEPAEAACSLCAACCVSAALPTGVSAVDHFSTSGAVAPLLESTALAFVTAGPDRPPRLHLA